ncbi:hypothetical protein [Desulfitobacterium metallireducens]|uniref:Uncharacterized protein n=1 Tax=Desulfitobacterium metallireducens DSM 15288 TaxID=871968 RepID=W0EGD9_9FIRM|nr:hypothetical protein [Desulfitobacterium metallireducens]AHF08583.1 hypothetical protein DESME_09010 [Desulfitobacterium metallireducens DSM 15288]
MDSNVDPEYKMIPNIVVQNITLDGVLNNSYIQMFGKRTVAYLYALLELQNRRGYAYFSINMILWLLKIKNSPSHERKYFRDFLIALKDNSLIEFCGEIDIESLNADDFVSARLDIYERNGNGNVQRYFGLLDSEFNTIINTDHGKLDKYNLLNLFCNIKSRIKRNANDISPAERKPEVAYPSYETIGEDIFIQSQATLKQYINRLVELDLIRYMCAGDMIFKLDGQQPIRRKANFTYTLFRDGWEAELDNSITAFKSQKRKAGWSFTSKVNEVTANEKRSVSLRIYILQKKKEDSKITQTEKKELSKLLRQKQKWQYDNDVNVRKLEEERLKRENPGKSLSQIYVDMSYEAKADRACEEEDNDDQMPFHVLSG